MLIFVGGILNPAFFIAKKVKVILVKDKLKWKITWNKAYARK